VDLYLSGLDEVQTEHKLSLEQRSIQSKNRMQCILDILMRLVDPNTPDFSTLCIDTIRSTWIDSFNRSRTQRALETMRFILCHVREISEKGPELNDCLSRYSTVEQEAQHILEMISCTERWNFIELWKKSSGMDHWENFLELANSEDEQVRQFMVFLILITNHQLNAFETRYHLLH